MSVFTAFIRRLFTVSAILMLAACGGGGGGKGGGGSAPGFSVSPGSLMFNATSTTSPTPAPQTITVTVTGGTVYLAVGFTGQAIANATFAITGPTTGVVTVYPASPASLGIGSYAGTVRIIGCNDVNCVSQVSGSPKDVAVTYQITGLTASPASVNLNTVVSTPSAAVPVNLSSSTGTASWSSSISYTGGTTGWLTLNPASGSSLPATLNFSGAAVAVPGTYTATVTLTSGSQVLTVPVNYVVNKALSPSVTALTYTVGNAPAPADLTQQISVGAYAGVTWTAASSVPWLSVSPASGGAGGTLSANLVQAQLDTRNNGTYTGTITLAPSVGTTETIAVTLTISRTQVNFVAPYVAMANTSAEVIVRGENFNQIAVQNVKFGSTNATTFTVVSNTEIRATHPALTAGSYPVQLENALGVNRSLATLAVVTPPAYGAVAYASAGTKSRIIYDDERRTIYVANAGSVTVERYAYDAGTTSWAYNGLSVPQFRDAALSTDGTQLVAVSDAAVHVLDPVTLAETGQTPFTGNSGGFYYLRQIAFANDGKAVVATGINGSGYTTTYLYNMRAPALTSLTSAYFAPLGASADGSRVVFGDSGISPAQLVCFYSASTGTVVSSAAARNVSNIVLNRTASRTVLNRGEVFDSGFTLLGNLPSTSLAVVLSPDGTIAYTHDSGGKVRKFDLTGALVAGYFPEVGTGTTPPASPGTSSMMTISLDGGSLFIAGNQNVVIMPAP
jgi:hypothetical protein